MNKLLKLSTALILIGCLNYSANAAISTQSTQSTQTVPVASIQATPKLRAASTMQGESIIGCDSVLSFGDGFAPVLGQLNTYQAAKGSQDCGGGAIYPSGWVRTPPAGAKLLDKSGKPISPSNLPPLGSGLTRITPVPIVAAPIATPAPASVASVQWLPSMYYRYPSPGGMIYVNDNDGTAYLQQPNGTKTNLPPVPNGQFLRRPPQYQLPGWLLGKWTQNPADNDEYFVAAGNGNSSNRIISKGPDGVLQVNYTTQNQWTDRNGVVHQVAPAGPVATSPPPKPQSPQQLPSRAPSCYDAATGIHCG